MSRHGRQARLASQRRQPQPGLFCGWFRRPRMVINTVLPEEAARHLNDAAVTNGSAIA
jgi:hypothetical protein